MTGRTLSLDIGLTGPQRDFALSEDVFPAFVGGFGAGKTEALVTRMLLLKIRYPSLDVGYFAPTSELLRLIAWPRFEEKLDSWKIGHKLNRGHNVLALKTGGKVIFRTLERPDRIVGFEIADAGLDELDTLRRDHAQRAWNKVIARCRQKKPDGAANSAAVATTPEGFRFVHALWERDRKAGYQMFRAPTRSNPFLPPGYIDQLRATYPPQLLNAYLEGQFVNLTSGAVYPEFCRTANHSAAELVSGEAVHAGVDFNVYNCTAMIGAIRDGHPVMVDELTAVRDTPLLARMLKERYRDIGHQVTVYPDASGQGHKTVNASLSDLQILKDHGLQVVVNGSNPLVKDRVTAVNAAICKRTLLVNTRRCPVLTEALEQQVYDRNGAPDKSAGQDHAPDALGYFIVALWPVVKPVIARKVVLPYMGR